MKKEFIFTDKWLDLLFENRNHQYGAYVLRKRNSHNVAVGFLIAVLLLISSVFITGKLSEVASSDITEVIIDLMPADKIYTADPLPKPPVQKAVTTPAPSQPKADNTNVAPVVIDSVITIDDKNKTTFNDDLNKSNKPSDSTQTTDTGILPFDTDSHTYDSYEALEKFPQFDGGEEAMLRYLAKTTRFPPRYLEERIDGATVYISFVVNKDGKVTEVKTVRGVEGYPDFANSASKSISNMPDWNPGKQNGSNVSVRFTMPVKFSIKKN